MYIYVYICEYVYPDKSMYIGRNRQITCENIPHKIVTDRHLV
jgi:hypothetical protein